MVNQDISPKEIVKELDRYIIGQEAAKKSVAVALRNRYRRLQLEEEMQQEVTPKNTYEEVIDWIENKHAPSKLLDWFELSEH